MKWILFKLMLKQKEEEKEEGGGIKYSCINAIIFICTYPYNIWKMECPNWQDLQVHIAGSFTILQCAMHSCRKVVMYSRVKESIQAPELHMPMLSSFIGWHAFVLIRMKCSMNTEHETYAMFHYDFNKTFTFGIPVWAPVTIIYLFEFWMDIFKLQHRNVFGYFCIST